MPPAADSASAAAMERTSFEGIASLLVCAGTYPADERWSAGHARRRSGSDRRRSGGDERRIRWHGWWTAASRPASLIDPGRSTNQAVASVDTSSARDLHETSGAAGVAIGALVAALVFVTRAPIAVALLLASGPGCYRNAALPRAVAATSVVTAAVVSSRRPPPPRDVHAPPPRAGYAWQPGYWSPD